MAPRLRSARGKGCRSLVLVVALVVPALLCCFRDATEDGPATFVVPPGGHRSGNRHYESALLSLAGLSGGTVMASAATAVTDVAAMEPAPSGVNTLAEPLQALVFFACYAVVAAVAFILKAGLSALEGALPEGWFANWQKTWPVIGAFFLAAGLAHFSAKDAFESIYPPQGTWGFWYLPGSPEFHVLWTGVAELLGGIGLFGGSLVLGIAKALDQEVPDVVKQLHAFSALFLFAVIICVTPANIFMYTHGANMVGLTPGNAAIPVAGHYARAFLQSVLLAFLYGYWEFAKPKTSSA